MKENHLIVNIPEFKLHAIENDSLIWSMNVVVGKSQHKTVIFNGDIKYVVFSPYWNIPASIMKNETLPAIRKNKNYLRNHDMEWNGNGIRQKPGPNNSLGLVKFLFPNSHSIYLHDSPAKSLFNESSRAFSHGCIRVAEAQKLAQYLLKYDSSWTDQKIVEAMYARKEKYVTLQQPVPVFIAYFTCWVNKIGHLQFRKDIYNRDARLVKMVLQ
jgi:murein L,D-transpeptidase YcbB/YkuD